MWEKPKNTPVAMADFDDNGGSFTLVEDSHRGKNIKYLSRNLPVSTIVMKCLSTFCFKQTQLLEQKYW